MSDTILSISRRRFVVGSAVAGAGFTLGMTLPFGSRRALASEGFPKEINAWVVIDPDDTVTIRIARSEMGQGTLTGLAQLVAEELECDWSKVTTEYPTPGQSIARERVWGSFSTGGSRGIRESHQYVREGGAAARTMLVEAAAIAWSVPAAECSAANSVITHAPSGRTTTYGKVASAAARLPLPEKVTLKDPKDWKVIGKPVPRLDTLDKLTGKQVYAADLKLTGMLNAAIKACPTFGGKVKSYDADKVKGMPGVRAVVPVDENAVAVVAETWWQAKTALDALPIEWDRGEHGSVTSADLARLVESGLTADDAFVGNKVGDAANAIAGAARTVEAVYSYPFQNHATMEPMNATAKWTKDRCEVWCPTQNGEAAHAATAEAAGLPLEQCEVYKLHLGGGFGRRGAADYVRQVVAIAKQMPGTPVKLLWTREEDMQQGMYHPLTTAKLVGGFDADGQLVGLHVRISGQSIREGLAPGSIGPEGDLGMFQSLLPELPQSKDHAISYTIPNLLVDGVIRQPHIRPGFWRGVNANQNVVYMECFMDELAHAAGKDPLEFRRALMKNNPGPLAVLNAVAERVGWGTPAAAGVHRGLAVCTAFGSYVAACAEVSVDAGKVKIHRIVAATDPGIAVNPQQIEAQVEGSFVYGLSAMLYGECTVKDGAIEQDNFHTYPSMRIAEMPAVETLIVPTGGFWGGVGEPTIAVAAPAVLNAIFAATGKRVRRLPLKHTDLSAA